jgi:hypothetical protein
MKKQLLVPLILGVFITSVNAHEQIKGEDSNSHHHHRTVMISDDQPVPSVDLVVHQDSLKGWNLEIKLDNFEFTPEMVNQANEPNKGHAHLYINGEKITRIYGNWYYLETLPVGRNEIKIGLNTNSHESLMYQEKLIEDIEVIEVE